MLILAGPLTAFASRTALMPRPCGLRLSSSRTSSRRRLATSTKPATGPYWPTGLRWVSHRRVRDHRHGWLRVRLEGSRGSCGASQLARQCKRRHGPYVSSDALHRYLPAGSSTSRSDWGFCLNFLSSISFGSEDETLPAPRFRFSWPTPLTKTLKATITAP